MKRKRELNYLKGEGVEEWTPQLMVIETVCNVDTNNLTRVSQIVDARRLRCDSFFM